MLELPMLLEFGPPKNFNQAVIRIPDRTHPNFEIHKGPYEQCAHLKEFLEKAQTIGCNGWFWEYRLFPAYVDDIRLLSGVNSFKRDLETSKTIKWSFLDKEHDDKWFPLPVGDNNHKWWQISRFKPETMVDGCRLFCIEINSSFTGYPDVRFDDKSEFEIALAKPEEIENLIDELVKNSV